MRREAFSKVSLPAPLDISLNKDGGTAFFLYFYAYVSSALAAASTNISIRRTNMFIFLMLV